MARRTQTKTLGPISGPFIQNLIKSGKIIFSIDEAQKILSGTKQNTSHFLRDLVNRGVLARLKSGIFLILQMGQENTQLNNWPLIAHFIAGENNYYISHYSAMRLHGMTTHPLIDVTITMPKRTASKKINDMIYKFIYINPHHFWGSMQFWATKQNKIIISDLERTILDGFDRPELCGGTKEIIRGLWSKQKEIDWQKLVRYSKKYHSKAAIKRLGFILESLNLGNQCLDELLKIVGSKKDYVLLDSIGDKFGKYLSRWNIQVNMNIDEIKASVWS